MGANKEEISKKHDDAKLGNLTRQQLKDLEARDKSKLQKTLDLLIMVLPIICGIIAICEYKFIPDNSPNENPNTYLGLLIILIGAYVLYLAYAGIKNARNDKTVLEKIRYKAPLYSALFLLLGMYDYLTL